MRWIFLTLLLLNLLVFAVQWSGAERVAEPENREEQVAGSTSLVLLKETTGPDSAPSARSERTKVPADASGLCLMVGPWETEVDAQKFLALLRSKVVESRIITNEIKREPDYWVYLPPFESRNAAIRKLRELQQDYKVDSYLISQGPLANGISLGLFKNIEMASEVQKERMQQGIAAKLAEVERTMSEFWVVATEPSTEELVAKITRLMDEENIQRERRQIFCKSVASG